MLAIGVVIAAVVTSLKSIPEVDARYGEGGVYAQADDEFSRDLADAVDAIPSPGLMVVYDGFSGGQLGQVQHFAHQMTFVLRHETVAEYHAAVSEILYGVPEEGGEELPFLHATIQPGLDIAGVPTFGRLLDSNGTELWQLTLTLIEQGG